MTSVTIARPVSSRAAASILRPVFLVPLEAVGAGPRLERPAAQAGGPQRLELAGQADDLLLALDRAGAGDHRDLASRRPRGRGPGRRSARAFSSDEARL